MCGTEGQELLFYLSELFLKLMQAEDKARNVIRAIILELISLAFLIKLV